MYKKIVLRWGWCRNLIFEKITRQKKLFNSVCVCVNLSREKGYVDKKDLWKVSKLEVCLAKFNAIMKCRRISGEAFQNNNITKDDLGPLVQEYAKKGGLWHNLKEGHTKFFPLEGTIITPLLLFRSDIGLDCKKWYRYVHYIPMMCLHNFIQSAVSATRQGDESLDSTSVAESRNVTSNQIFWLPIYGSWSTNNQKVSQCWKNTWGNQ